MSTPLEGLRPPQYLDDVVRLIELPFFSDPRLETQAHTNPNALPRPEVRARIPMYIAGLRLMAKCRDYSIEDAREEYAHEIGELRGQLMTIDEGLETPAVAGLRLALSQLPRPHASQTPLRPPGAEMLPPTLLPTRAVDRLFGLRRGTTLEAMKRNKKPATRLKLPGPARAEYCFTWSDIRDVQGSRPPHSLLELEAIRWEDLPTGPEDTRPDRIAYAQKLQSLVVASYKLQDPEAIARPTLPRARAYHISHGRLGNLLGGGTHFIEDYCTAHGLKFMDMERWDGWGLGEYLRLEQAAQIWQAFMQFPQATEQDIPLNHVAQTIPTTQSTLRGSLTADESRQLTPMRALRPHGRVIEHMPKELAAVIIGRLKRLALPPHLLPALVLEKVVNISYSGIKKNLTNWKSPCTMLLLQGTKHRALDCYDWQIVQRLVYPPWGGYRQLEGGPAIEFELLPRGPNESDPDRIAYARSIQAQLVPAAMLDDSTAPAGPPVIPEDLPASRQLPLIPILSGAETQQPEPVTNEPWAPSATMNPKTMIGSYEQLTAQAIAERLGIDLGTVTNAIAKVLGSRAATPAEGQPATYTGSRLIALREFLVGTSAEVVIRTLHIPMNGWPKVQNFLRQHGYQEFAGARYDPSVIAFLRHRVPQALAGHDPGES